MSRTQGRLSMLPLFLIASFSAARPANAETLEQVQRRVDAMREERASAPDYAHFSIINYDVPGQRLFYSGHFYLRALKPLADHPTLPFDIMGSGHFTTKIEGCPLADCVRELEAQVGESVSVLTPVGPFPGSTRADFDAGLQALLREDPGGAVPRFEAALRGRGDLLPALAGLVAAYRALADKAGAARRFQEVHGYSNSRVEAFGRFRKAEVAAREKARGEIRSRREASERGFGQLTSSRRTIVVASDGSGDLRTLNDLPHYLRAGESVLVRKGRYTDMLIEGLKGVTVSGEAGAVLDGFTVSEAENVEIQGLTVLTGASVLNSKSVVVKGLRARFSQSDADSATASAAVVRSGEPSRYGLFIEKSRNVVVEDCRVEGFRNAGIGIHDADSVRVRQCLLRANGNLGGVSVTKSAGVAIENNTIVGHAKAEGAVTVVSASASFLRNIIAFNEKDFGFPSKHKQRLLDSESGTKSWSEEVSIGFVRDNLLFRNGTPAFALFKAGDRNELAKHNRQGDPGFMDPEREDYRLRADSAYRREGIGALLEEKGEDPQPQAASEEFR